MSNDSQLFRCGKCNTPIFAIQNNCLVIESRHHGEKHTTAIPILDLVYLAYGLDIKTIIEEWWKQNTLT